MDEAESNQSQLQIRCPNCGQRFKVGADLRGKLVECGSCEERFRVNDDAILRSRKFYPGEAKRDAHLERFARAPISGASPVDFQTASYNPAPNPEVIEPPSLQRVLAGGIGVVMMALLLLLFLLSTSGGGPMAGVSTGRRLILAGFIAVLGSLFILYANRHRLLPAAVGCGLASVVLLAMPVIFPAPDELLDRQVSPVVPARRGAPAPDPDGEEQAGDSYAAIKEEIRYGPVEAEIKAAGSAEKVTAIWLRGMRGSYKWPVEEFLLRVTGASRTSHMYPRGDDAALMVLTGIDQEIEVTAQHCKRLGLVERVMRPLRVIEVVVAGEHFTETPIERLSDTSSDDFYGLNYRELDSIDLGRVERAVERLSNAEPSFLRADIVGRMIALLDEVPPEICDQLATALGRWAGPDDGAEQAVLAVVRRIGADGKKPGEGVIAFLVERGVAEVLPFLHQQWLENPDSWEQLYMSLGEPARGPMTAAVEEEKISIRYSAARILGRVGNVQTIPVLEAMKTGKDPELESILVRSIAQIRQRDPEAGGPDESVGGAE